MHRKYAFQLRSESDGIYDQQPPKFWQIFSHNGSGCWLIFLLEKKDLKEVGLQWKLVHHNFQ